MKKKPGRRPASARKRSGRAPLEPPPPADLETLLAEREQLLAQVESLREAHLEVEESQQLYAELFDQAPLGYVNLTEWGVIQTANLAAGRLLELEPRELAGRHFRTFVKGDDLLRFMEHLQKCHVPESSEIATELRLTRKNLDRIVEMISRPTTVFGSTDIIYRTLLRDITERREAEASLWASQERLRLIVENARDYAILSMELDRTITSWNSGAEAMLGYSAGEVVGKSADLIFTPEDRAAEAPQREAKTALRKGRASDERWHLRKDGSRFWGSGVMMPMRNGRDAAVGLLKIFRDHTAEWETRQALETSRDAAEAATRAKDQFLAVLSHELRTPLTPITMATHMLLRRPDLAPEMRDTLEMIRRNVQIEARFVEDLLQVSRIRHGKLEMKRETVDLHEVVKRAIEVTRADLEARPQELTVSLAARQSTVEGDSDRLQQVMWNLLRNAVKFTPEDGKISIRSRNDGQGRIVIEVSDTGIGIEAHAQTSIFDAFSQASQKITAEHGGLGLGLAIAKGIVTAHGGEISATSEGADRGTVFTLVLPLQKGSRKSPPRNRAPSVRRKK